MSLARHSGLTLDELASMSMDTALEIIILNHPDEAGGEGDGGERREATQADIERILA